MTGIIIFPSQNIFVSYPSVNMRRVGRTESGGNKEKIRNKLKPELRVYQLTAVVIPHGFKI